MRTLFSLVAQLNIRPFLKEVQCPALIMHSEDDKIAPIKASQDFIEDCGLSQCFDYVLIVYIVIVYQVNVTYILPLISFELSSVFR